MVRLSSMGDVVITTPVCKNLREYYTGSQIVYLTRGKYTPILDNNPHLSGVIPLHDKDLSWLRYLKFCLHLRKSKFDLVVDLHNNPRSRILSSILSSPTVIRVDKKRATRMKMVYFKHQEPDISMATLFLNTLENIGIAPLNYPPEMYLSENEKWKVKNMLKLEDNQKVVGLHPYARWKSKEWDFGNYLQVALELNKVGCKVLFFGEKPPEMAIPEVEFHSGLSLVELIHRISVCDLYIGNDTGPTHVAASLGIPVIAIFGPTHPSLGFRPAGKNVVRIVHSNLDCSPCTFHGEDKCKYESYKCMEAIKPEQLLQEALTILEGLNQDE